LLAWVGRKKPCGGPTLSLEVALCHLRSAIKRCRPVWVSHANKDGSKLVNPEIAKRLSGIHTPDGWLWIPGSRLARPGMTAAIWAVAKSGGRPLCCAALGACFALLFCLTGKSPVAMSIPDSKNISLLFRGKSPAMSAPSLPERGAFRDRHGRWAGMRWTQAASARKRDRRAGSNP
jgi:hypothetical protein